MEHCDGRTHSEMTDAYDSHSYPCPGPDKCANAAKLLRDKEGPFKSSVVMPDTLEGKVTISMAHIRGKTLDHAARAIQYECEALFKELLYQASKEINSGK